MRKQTCFTLPAALTVGVLSVTSGRAPTVAAGASLDCAVCPAVCAASAFADAAVAAALAASFADVLSASLAPTFCVVMVNLQSVAMELHVVVASSAVATGNSLGLRKIIPFAGASACSACRMLARVSPPACNKGAGQRAGGWSSTVCSAACCVCSAAYSARCSAACCVCSVVCSAVRSAVCRAACRGVCTAVYCCVQCLVPPTPCGCVHFGWARSQTAGFYMHQYTQH